MNTREDETKPEIEELAQEPLAEDPSPVVADENPTEDGENNDADVIFDITPKDKKVRRRTFRKRLHSFFSIRDDVASHDKIRERIVNGGKITGTNASILIFAILIACCGLYTNSIPVVIGAMLISPLMGTLMAISYGVTSADARFTRDAMIGFLFQFLISFVIACLFFLILPKCPAPSEFLKRCHPNIFDLIIAICGGAAGTIRCSCAQTSCQTCGASAQGLQRKATLFGTASSAAKRSRRGCFGKRQPPLRRWPGCPCMKN